MVSYGVLLKYYNNPDVVLLGGGWVPQSRQMRVEIVRGASNTAYCSECGTAFRAICRSAKYCAAGLQ